MSATTWFLVANGITAMSGIPLILKIVPPNWFYGMRTRQTLSHPELWFRANRFLGWSLLLAAAVSAFLLTLIPLGEPTASFLRVAALVAPLAAATGASFVYIKVRPPAMEEKGDEEAA